jgi:hypothetical protein
MPSLPNLSKLSIGLPADEDLPKVFIRKEFKVDEQLANFKNGHTFSCVNGQIQVTPPRTNSELEQMFTQLEAFDMGRQNGRSSGSFNQTKKLDRSELGGRAHALAASKSEPGNFPDVILRASKDYQVANEITHIQVSSNGRKSTFAASEIQQDMMFQEVYLTLYAAQHGIGPEIYAARVTFVTFRGMLIPRLVMLMESGIGTLTDYCEINDSFPNMTGMSKMLLELIKESAKHKLLLIDLKPGNIIFFEDDSSPNGIVLKAIDFDATNTVVMKEEHEDCIAFIMCILMISMVTSFHGEDVPANDLTYNCFFPFLSALEEYVKTWIPIMERDPQQHGRLCQAVLSAVFNPRRPTNSLQNDKTLLDAPKMVNIVVDRLLYVAHHYSDPDKKIVQMMNGIFFDNEDKPTLYRTQDFDPTMPFLLQLAKNAIKYLDAFAPMIKTFPEGGAGGSGNDTQNDPADPNNPQNNPENDPPTPLDPWIERRGNLPTPRASPIPRKMPLPSMLMDADREKKRARS